MKLNTKAGLIFFILLASFLADSSTYFFIRFVYPNSYIIGNTWYIINFILVALLFVKILPSKKKIILIVSILFLIGAVISFTWFYTFLNSNSFIKVFSSVVFTVLSLLVYFELLKQPGGALKTMPVFWISNAIFIFSSVTLLRNLFLQYLVFDLKIDEMVYSYISLINLFANITKNFILFYVIILIDKGFPDSIKPVKAS